MAMIAAKRAQLHQDAGVESSRRPWGGHVTIGRPVVKRPDAASTPKPMKIRQEPDGLTSIGILPAAEQQIERCAPRLQAIAIESAEKYTASTPISATNRADRSTESISSPHTLARRAHVAMRMYIGR